MRAGQSEKLSKSSKSVSKCEYKNIPFWVRLRETRLADRVHSHPVVLIHAAHLTFWDQGGVP